MFLTMLSKKEDNNVSKVCMSLEEIMAHIASVQEEVSQLNFTAMQKVNDFIFDSGMEVDDSLFVALQHQDILTQQLSAIRELSEELQKHIGTYRDDLESLESKFLSALEIAKAKKEAYRGNAF